jgi:hypothetical protein
MQRGGRCAKVPKGDAVIMACQIQTARAALHVAVLGASTAKQQVTDLKERLLANETHRQSLEEKHAHAREAPEHYRQSVKQQHDQDRRRHEQQVQQFQAEMRR